MSDQTNNLTDTLSKVRALVQELIENEVSNKEITFALAYISAEFGLYITDGTVEVMPTILSAVSKAVADMDKSPTQTEASANSIEMPQQSEMTH